MKAAWKFLRAGVSLRSVHALTVGLVNVKLRWSRGSLLAEAGPQSVRKSTQEMGHEPGVSPFSSVLHELG